MSSPACCTLHGLVLHVVVLGVGQELYFVGFHCFSADLYFLELLWLRLLELNWYLMRNTAISISKGVIQIVHKHLPYPAFTQRVLSVQGCELPPQSL